MSLGFDTSMNKYTIDDLLKLLELGSNPSQAEIVNKITNFNTIFVDNSGVIQFLNNIQDKLLDNFKQSTAYTAEGFNYFDYNIENPLFSQLPLAAPDFDENSDFNPEDLIECYEITQEDLDQEEDERIELTHQEEIRIDNTKNKEFRTLTSYTYDFCDLDISVTNKDRTIFKYTLDNTLTNITELCVASIKIPRPYTISEYKNNNKITIIDVSNSISYEIDIGNHVTYLSNNNDITTFVTNLNNEFTNHVNTEMLHYISVSSVSVGNHYKIKFDLASNNVSSLFSLDFNVSENLCGLNYSLSTLLGFEQMIYQNISSVTGENHVNFDNNIYYLSLNDYTYNFHQNLIIMSNKLKDKNIITSIQVNANTQGTADMHLISKVPTHNTLDNPIRKYNGYINLLNFEIKIFDNVGNLQQMPLRLLNDNNFNFKLTITREI